MCKSLDINTDVVAKGAVPEAVDIRGDILGLDTSNPYFDAFNDDRQLYKLLSYLKRNKNMDHLHKVVAMYLFKSYYQQHTDGSDEEDADLKQLHALCDEQFHIPAETLTKLEQVTKQETRLQNQKNALFV